MYDGLSPDRVIFSGDSLSNMKLYIVYDYGHYNVITNLTAAMVKRYIYNACETFYDKACSLCTAIPPCFKNHSKYCGSATGGS